MAKTSSVAKENLSGVEQQLPRPKGRAFAALICSNILLAFGGLLVRFSDSGPTATAFWRMLLAAPILWLLVWKSGEKSGKLSPALIGTIILGGLFFSADLASWHSGILLTKLANATLFGNFASLLLVIYGIILARQLPGKQQGVAIGLAFAGSAILMGQSYEASRDYLIGDMLSLLAGVLYTGYVIAMQRARGSLGSWAVLAISTSVSILPLLVIAQLMGEQIMPSNWTPLIILAITSQVMGQGLLIYSLPHFSPLVVGLALLLQPAIAGVAGWVAFGESLGPMELVGTIMVAVALVLVRAPEKA